MLVSFLTFLLFIYHAFACLSSGLGKRRSARGTEKKEEPERERNRNLEIYEDENGGKKIRRNMRWRHNKGPEYKWSDGYDDPNSSETVYLP